MPTLTGTVTFTVGNASPTDTTTGDLLTLNPPTTGTLALRRLTYPSDVLPPLVYEDNPDIWTNFWNSPLDKRPRVVVSPTLSANPLVGWLGVSRDQPIKELWQGSQNKSRMTMAWFLQLQAYYENPPTGGSYIIWEPRDRTSKKYNIVIESLSLSQSGSAGQGAGDYEFNYLAAIKGYTTGVVEFQFRIISEAV